MPIWVQAGLWGLLGGSALVLGAAVAWVSRLSQRVIAGVMAIGAGVLISAVAFDLMDEAYQKCGFDSTAKGFIAGAGIYTVANYFLNKKGAKNRKRSGSQQAKKEDRSKL